MMGSHRKLEPKLFYTSVNLNERIPPKHLLRRLRDTLDLEFARPVAAVSQQVVQSTLPALLALLGLRRGATRRLVAAGRLELES